MYVQSKGMGRYRSGLGGLRRGMGAMTCDTESCWDDGTGAAQSKCTCVNGLCVENGNSCATVGPAGPVGSPAYIAQQLALQNAAIRTQQAGMPFNFTQWLNNNTGTALAVSLGFVGLIVVAKAGR